jgi:hypothetical protein
MHFRNASQRCPPLSDERAAATHVDIEPAVGSGCLDVERFSREPERLCYGPCGWKRTSEAGRQNRTSVDGDNVVGAGCREADFQNIVNAAPCVQYDAPAACAMCVNKVTDRCNHICLGQRLQD